MAPAAVSATAGRRRTRRAIVAGALSFVLPGAGQWYAGRRRAGTVFLGASTLMLAGAVWLAVQSVGSLARVLITPAAVIGLLVGNVAVLAVRAAATVHAYDVVRGPRDDRVQGVVARAGTVAAVTLLVLALAVPHAVVGFALARGHTTVTRVFAGDTAETPRPTTDTDRAAAAPTPDRAATRPANPDDVPDESPTIAPEASAPERATANRWDAAGRLTVAVLGLDAGPGRSIARTDVLMVVSIDTATGASTILSVDRYLRDFPVPEGFADLYDEHCATGGAWDYLNALHPCAYARVPERFAERYPETVEPAAAAVADTLELLLGVPVDHYALVDMAGFVRVVDALGGIDIDMAEPIVVRVSPAHDDTEWRTFRMPAGLQTLDGETALAYARMRDPGDAPRMRRQRCLLASVAERTSVGRVVRRLPTLLAAVEDHVVTDIPVTAFPDLVEVLTSVDHDRLVAVGIGPPEFRDADHRPRVEQIRAHVAAILADPATAIDAGGATQSGDEVCRAN